MSIKSGQRYKITNEQTKLVVDLSGADNKSIIGWNYHGGENQQWIPEEQDDGQWTIQSVTQKYLGFEKVRTMEHLLSALDKPQSWEIEILDSDDPAKTNVKLCVCGTIFVADFPLDKPVVVVGTGLQLWTGWNGKNQVWVLEECP